MEYHLAKIGACAFALLAGIALVQNVKASGYTAHKSMPYWLNAAVLGVSVWALLKLAGCC